MEHFITTVYCKFMVTLIPTLTWILMQSSFKFALVQVSVGFQRLERLYPCNVSSSKFQTQDSVCSQIGQCILIIRFPLHRLKSELIYCLLIQHTAELCPVLVVLLHAHPVIRTQQSATLGCSPLLCPTLCLVLCHPRHFTLSFFHPFLSATTLLPSTRASWSTAGWRDSKERERKTDRRGRQWLASAE